MATDTIAFLHLCMQISTFILSILIAAYKQSNCDTSQAVDYGVVFSTKTDQLNTLLPAKTLMCEQNNLFDFLNISYHCD